MSDWGNVSIQHEVYMVMLRVDRDDEEMVDSIFEDEIDAERRRAHLWEDNKDEYGNYYIASVRIQPEIFYKKGEY